MSTILDALRKAQAKHEEEDDGDDAVERSAAGGTEPAHAESTATDISTTFDDAAPADRIATAAKRPNVVAAVAVGLVGLALGVGAARTIAGKLFFGGGEESARVASAKPAEQDDGKKSPALADTPAPGEKHVQRESRTHPSRASKSQADDAAVAGVSPSGEAAEPEAPIEADAGAPDAARGLPRDTELAHAPAVASGSPPAPLANAQVPPPALGQAPAPQPAAPIVGPPIPPSLAVPPVNPAPGVGIAPAQPAGFGGAQAPGAPPEPVQPAALAAPGISAPAAPGEPAAGTVLEAPPSGSPEVSLLFIKWSHEVERRVASLRGPGGKLLLVREGDIVEGMRVSLIRADAVELQWRGSNFLLYAAR